MRAKPSSISYPDTVTTACFPWHCEKELQSAWDEPQVVSRPPKTSKQYAAPVAEHSISVAFINEEMAIVPRQPLLKGFCRERCFSLLLGSADSLQKYESVHTDGNFLSKMILSCCPPEPTAAVVPPPKMRAEMGQQCSQTAT